MSEGTFRPSLREDGTFDPDCLEQAGQRWVTTWLKNRLSGHDPYFPIDKRGDEAPSGLIVSILRDAGSTHPSTALIGRGILNLLDEARKLAPEIPPYLKPALEISQRVRLPSTSIWFTEELRGLAADPKAVDERWGTRLVKEILHGAIRQSPGLKQAASHASWQAVLNIPRYATLAWMGLAQSFIASLDYMEAWWKACPVDRRQAEIDQFIFTGLKTEGSEKVHEFLGDPFDSWAADLQAAVDSALEKNGEDRIKTKRKGAAFAFQGSLSSSPLLRSSSHRSAIDEAARRRESVLRKQRAEQAARVGL
ncbi:MAG TPA: hypothetical protein VIA62_12205 [Thermoanaerobaculia bacterium]|jgi:hypothetical protein|nr:hypothetical protein [Thermoanaerobaculia bacterium]